MRVGQFTTRYPFADAEGPAPYRPGGAERVVERLAREAAAAGHDVHVFAAGGRRDTTADAGVAVHRYRRLATVGSTDLAPALPVGPLAAVADLDVVHAHHSTPPGLVAGALYARARGVPLVVTHHGGEWETDEGGAGYRLVRRAYLGHVLERVLDAASVVVLPSGGYRRESTALAGVQTPTRVIGNGAPLPDTRPVAAVREALGVDPDRYVVAFVGVHERWKGVDVLIDAFAALASDDTRPRPLLVVMGTGAETEALRDRARRLGVGDAVRFAGYVPEATKRSYLRAADVCAVPTRVAGAEMSPLVLGEAAAAGTALVASDFPALRDALADREPAVFVDPDDPAALAAALRDLRADPGRRERLAAAGLAHARATPWGDAAAAYLSLYREVVDGG